jgi:hypothetical protein
VDMSSAASAGASVGASMVVLSSEGTTCMGDASL